MNCKNCGANIKEGARFCPKCGAEVTLQEQNTEQEITYCAKCGAANKPGATFCTKCGQKIEKKKKKGKKKMWLILMGAVAGLIVLAVIFFLGKSVLHLFTGEKEQYCLYVRNGNLYSVSAKKIKDEPLRYGGGDIASGKKDVQINSDEKYICYINEKDSSYGGELWIAELGKENGDRTKIDEDVCSFQLMENNKILYIDSNNAMYMSDYKGEKEKMASNVSDYYLDSEEKRMIWLSDSGYDTNELYFRNLKSDDGKVRIAEDVDVCAVSDDFEKIYIIDDDDRLYLISNLEQIDMVDDNVQEIFVRDSMKASKVLTDKIFYTKTSKRKEPVSKYVENDRGDLYSDFMKDFFEYEIQDLYCYDGKTTSLIEEGIDSVLGRSSDRIIYNKGNTEEMKKVKLSDSWNSYEMEWDYDELEINYDRTIDSILFVGGKKVQLQEKMDTVKIDTESGMSYGISYTEEWDPYMCGTIYRFVSDEKADGGVDYIDDDAFSIEKVKDDKVYYLNTRDGVACLCLNGDVIEENVYVGSLKLKGDYAYYLEGNNCDLLCYDGKNAKIIADDAGGGCDIKNRNSIFYITNYDSDRQSGDLIFYDGEKHTLIEEDVERMIGSDMPEVANTYR